MDSPEFPDLLAPYKSDAIARAAGVNVKTVRLWRTRKTTPMTDKIPAIAEFLRVEIGVVVQAIAHQKRVA